MLIKTAQKKIRKEKKKVRRPGVEPGSTAWKATMLTVTPPTLHTQTGDFSHISLTTDKKCPGAVKDTSPRMHDSV